MRPRTPSWLTGSETGGENQKSRNSHIFFPFVNGPGSRSSALTFTHQRSDTPIFTTSPRNFRHSMASQIPFAMRKLKLNNRPRASSRATTASMACYDESAYRLHFDSQSSEFDVSSQASRPVSRWSSSTEGGNISPKKTGQRKSKTNSIFARRPGSPTSIASTNRTSMSRTSISVLGRHKKRASKSKLGEVSEFDPTTFRKHRMRPKTTGANGSHDAIYQEYDDLFDDTLEVLEDIPDEELVPEITEVTSNSSSRKGSEAGSFFFLCGNDSRSEQASPNLPKILSHSPLRADFSSSEPEDAKEELDTFSRCRESLRSLRQTGTATPPYSKPGSYEELYSSAITGTDKVLPKSPPTPPPKIDSDEIVPPRLVEALAPHETANNYGNIKRNSEMRVISYSSPGSQEALNSSRSTAALADLESSPTSIYNNQVPSQLQTNKIHSHPFDNTTSQQSPSGLGISNIPPPPIPPQSVLRFTQLINPSSSILNYSHSAQNSEGLSTPELEKDEGDSFGAYTPEEEDISNKMRSDVTSCLFEEVDGGVAPLFFSKMKKPLKIDSSVGGGRSVGIPTSAPLMRSPAMKQNGPPSSRRISEMQFRTVHELDSELKAAPNVATSPTDETSVIKSPTEPRMVSSVYDFSDLGFIPACEPWTPQSPSAKNLESIDQTVVVDEKQVVEDEDSRSCSDCESCASEVLDSMKEVVARPMQEIFNPSSWLYYHDEQPEETTTTAETDSIETKVETPEEQEAAKKERDLSYLRAFRTFLKRSRSDDAYIQRDVRFEFMQTHRYRAHVCANLPLTLPTKKPKVPKPLSKGELDAQVRDIIMTRLLSLMAYRWLNSGKLVISPAHDVLLACSYKRLDRRVKHKKDKRASELLSSVRHVQPDNPSAGRRRVLDLGGTPIGKSSHNDPFAMNKANRLLADWGWHCAYDYPRAKVYTVTLREVKTGDEDGSGSSSEEEKIDDEKARREEDAPRGPLNHRHVSVKCFWNLPFPDNHFDVISARTLYADLTNNQHTSSHSGRFIDEFDLVMEEVMRVLKPGGYFEYNLVDCEILNGSSSSREFAGNLAMNLADKNHDPFPARRFISRLHKAGFKKEEIKRSWIFAPLAASAPKPKPLPKDNIISPVEQVKPQLPGFPDLVMEEIKADMAKKMGHWEEQKAVPEGSTDGIAAISGLIGGWALERMACRIGMNGIEIATALGEVARDEIETGHRSGLKTLVGWARKSA